MPTTESSFRTGNRQFFVIGPDATDRFDVWSGEQMYADVNPRDDSRLELGGLSRVELISLAGNVAEALSRPLVAEIDMSQVTGGRVSNSADHA